MSDFKLTKRAGSENWYIRGTNSAGKEVFRSLKTKDEPTAKALLIQFQNRQLIEKVYGPEATTTFDEAARAYIADGGDRTYLVREDKLGQYHGLMPLLGETKLKDITQERLDAAAKALCRPGASRETLIRNVYTPFIAVWNYAASEARKMASPKKWQRPRKAKGTNVVRLTPVRSGTAPVAYERAAEFVAAMSPAPAMIMTTLFYTGLRPIELFSICADDVNVAGRWITLTKTKTGEPRGVPIHEFLVPLLKSLLTRNDLGDIPQLFRTPRGEPYEEIAADEKGRGGGGLKTAINGARLRLAREAYPNLPSNEVTLKMSPILDVSPYTGRHTVSTQLVINGIHPHIKDQILGHAADDMSRHYTNVPQKPLIEAINTLPVPDAWERMDWWENPLAWSGKLAEGRSAKKAGTRKRARG